MEQIVETILLVDTCSVYKLYFFKEGIIPSKEIDVPTLGRLAFHPIVKKEFQDDIESFYLYQNITPKPQKKFYPSFLDMIGPSKFSELEKFINENLATFQTTRKADPHFKLQKKVYDAYRIQLQDEWKNSNKFQNSVKAKSHPSDEDYSLLYDALKNKVSLVTNDEILKDIASHFFENNSLSSYTSEEVIGKYHANNPALKSKIVDVAKTLEYASEIFRLSIALGEEEA